VFLAGRTLDPLEKVADDITASGGQAETAQVDALDEESVDRHADSVAATAGSIDVSFNAIGHGDVHGIPLVGMAFDDFARPIVTAMRTLFLTGRAAARHMVKQGAGVLMANTATTARRVIPNVGGTGVSFDAIESLCRQWAAELGPQGIRVVWLQTTGIPEAMSDSGELFPDYGTWSPSATREELIALMETETMLKRLTSLAEIGNAAAFLASDQASAMTAAGANLTCGSISTR
jgi:NAD(P)-dependent dehydrogenase (short-subunit alcohol dehydrogenase family)